ncbi:MAG: hypothetical protein LLF28_05755 [Nitrospiraceae bacterium]|nr:hypothetical protein [Nitrospiraceae bacterium]
MKNFVSITTALVLVLGLASFASAAAWDKCAACHNGNVAKSTKDILIAKYKTVDEFIKGAKAATNPMMNAFKNNVPDLKASAAELGIK